ncbi:carbohydrate ABC transporter permease [Pseudovibrio exalbescens]|uniref:ABC transporter permease n=1 Tax=Pseudovibrio exalbescens TaxID=197461 RepID=A0A1U7JG89_9HYPH|nr:sugar ABC transporter permease [Pseudovibrio exalbescens]OKL43749.1 ABC transporter permease [Pseudovibrio exalbescens]
MRRTDLFGLGFMAPALILTIMFFLAPVVMTGVYSFTNMSTATGISGGAYLISPATIRSLTEQGFQGDAIERLSSESYVVDEAGLEAAEAAGYTPRFIAEIRSTLLGDTFTGRRDFERALKDLSHRPRSIRDLKKATELFQKSVLNVRFETEADFQSALSSLNLNLSPAEAVFLTETAYTGWIWTSANYDRAVNLPSTYRATANSAIYVTFTLAFNVGFGLFLAITTFYLPSGQAAFFRTIWFLPRILPPVLYVLMWKWLTWDTGFLSTLLSHFGVPPHNLMKHTATHAWVVVVLINGFVGASMGMILFSSAIRSIPQSMLHASEVDGANRWQQVRYIILPQLRWPILFTTAYQTLSLLTSFEYILLSTNGGPGSATNVWALYAFKIALNNYGGNLEYGYGAALAMVLVIIGIIASLFYLRLFNFKSMITSPRIEQ